MLYRVELIGKVGYRLFQKLVLHKNLLTQESPPGEGGHRAVRNFAWPRNFRRSDNRFRSKPRSLSLLLVQPVEKVANQRRDFIGRFVKGEMPRFENMNFRVGHVIGVGARAGNRERRVVFTPHHQ